MSSTIEETKAKHQNRLMRLPGVVSVGIGREPTGELAIVVGVVDTKSRHGSPFPTLLDGHPVRVEVVGTVKAQ
jgi:hypothetical protein